MQLVAQYLERAHQFERLAAEEKNPKAKKDLEDQAAAYYTLATKRAKSLNLPVPSKTSSGA
jgi:hypothetical protein